MAASTKLLFLFSTVFLVGSDGAVLELDEKFMDVKGQGMWLVEFYAPWCGHCKKLEPIYHQVALELRSSSIHVAKVDCTRYSSIASEFNVRGFPTIKFISGENVYTHRGERSKEDIVEFAVRAKGPAVRKLSSIGKFNEAKGEHSDGVFFLYIGDEDAKADLYIKYCDLAQKYIVASYFYNGTSKILPKDIKLKNYPTVLVFKDGLHFEYEGMLTKSSLEEWIVGERLTAFPLISGGTLNEIADINKLIVIFTVDTENKEEKTRNNRVKDMGEVLAKQHRETFHKSFQFVWMSDPEAVNSITMWSLSMPSILVLDPETHLYYLPSADPTTVILQDLSDFLLGVKQGTVQAHGGTGFFQRLKRVFYDLFTMVLSVWTASRWLFLLMFGLPTAIISIVCYSLCCMEPADDDGMMDSDEEDDQEGEITQHKQGEITSLQQGQITQDSDKSHVDQTSHPKSD